VALEEAFGDTEIVALKNEIAELEAWRGDFESFEGGGLPVEPQPASSVPQLRLCSSVVVPAEEASNHEGNKSLLTELSTMTAPAGSARKLANRSLRLYISDEKKRESAINLWARPSRMSASFADFGSSDSLTDAADGDSDLDDDDPYFLHVPEIDDPVPGEDDALSKPSDDDDLFQDSFQVDPFQEDPSFDATEDSFPLEADPNGTVLSDGRALQKKRTLTVTEESPNPHQLVMQRYREKKREAGQQDVAEPEQDQNLNMHLSVIAKYASKKFSVARARRASTMLNLDDRKSVRLSTANPPASPPQPASPTQPASPIKTEGPPSQYSAPALPAEVILELDVDATSRGTSFSSVDSTDTTASLSLPMSPTETLKLPISEPMSAIGKKPPKSPKTPLGGGFFKQVTSSASSPLFSQSLPVEIPTLDSVLSSQKGMNCFIAFCTESHYFQKMSFWLHVEELKMTRAAPEAALKLAESIYRRFFSDVGHVTLELPPSVHSRIKRNFEKLAETRGNFLWPGALLNLSSSSSSNTLPFSRLL